MRNFPSLSLRKYPFRTLFHKFVHQQAQIRKYEPTNIESEKLGCVANTEFQSNMRRRRVLESRVFDLACNLICSSEKHLALAKALNKVTWDEMDHGAW